MVNRGIAALRFALTKKRVWVYLALLALSNIVIAFRGPTAPPPPPSGAERVQLHLPRMSTAGPIADGEYRLSVLRWPAAASTDESPTVLQRLRNSVMGDDPDPLPVILLHGCPSSGGSDFSSFAPLIAASGRTVYAPDLPGSGASQRTADDYSIVTMARLVIAAMDELKIERAHIVGWSQGGGAALYTADLAPQRVASLTMLASIGAQETEGSGDYFFEHLKYRLGHALITILPELVPHFGLLGSRETRWALLQPFIDTDQRPVKALMKRLRTPTLILHGRHDFLVSAWAAEEHHRLIAPSTLVMLDANHFIPMGGRLAGDRVMHEAAAHLLVFLQRHDNPRAAPLRQAAVLCPPEAHITQKLGGFEVDHATPWWLIVIFITIATIISEDLTTITVGLLIVAQSIDWGVALVGCFFAIFIGDMALWLLGRTLGRRALRLPLIRNVINERSLDKLADVIDQHTGKTVFLSRCLPGTRFPTFIAAGILSKRPHVFLFWVAFAAFLWTPFLLVLTALVGPSLLGVFKTVFHGPWAIVAAIVVLFVVIRLIGYETTALGRDKLKADLLRWVSPEFWPIWIFYLPLLPVILWLAIRNRGLMTFTCANPGISHGGGFIGESKSEILRGFSAAPHAIATFELVPAAENNSQRADHALRALRERPDLGGFPVILKPDQGCRGYGLRIARNENDLREYFRNMTRAVIVQRFHPGPYEIGLLWSRIPQADEPPDNWPGEVFSATAKEFPVIVGDGKRNLETLIWHHPRYRMQAAVFLKRHADHASRVLAPSERFPLGFAGNHCQGARFIDGMPAVTRELADSIDRLSQNFRHPDTGRRLDFARFDIRYESEADLAAGRNFLIVEANGTSSESTSIYDPTKSIAWTYGLLFRHWQRLFQIGAARRREGNRPMSLRELFRQWRLDRRRPKWGVSD
ncbi:MAG: alpha/beta fold hydrolase [Phycisphaerae bacterium]|nr:alpha/beta fold hydrolase [Phycisphaerae bacterium]